MRILSGVQSSGKLHLGNYYGAIRQFLRLQQEGEALYFIADLHSLTTVRDAKLQRELVVETAVAFLSLGLDPAKAILFRQSDVPEILELYWILGTVCPSQTWSARTVSRTRLPEASARTLGCLPIRC